MTTRLAGVWPIVTTPFDAAGRLDLDSLSNVVEHVISGGAHGLVYPAIASEFQTLAAAERRHAVEHVLKLSAGRKPVIVGISCADDHQMPREWAEHAAVHAAAAVMLMPRPETEARALRDVFTDVARVCDRPIVFQNAPGPLGPGLGPETIVELLDAVPAIRYVKEETLPCGHRISRLLAMRPGRLAGIFGGAGGRFVLDELARGAIGSMPACEFTMIHVALYEHFRAGNRAEARRLYNMLLPLLNFESVFRTTATKAILSQLGVIASATHRDANPALDDADRRELASILEQIAFPFMDVSMMKDVASGR